MSCRIPTPKSWRSCKPGRAQGRFVFWLRRNGGLAEGKSGEMANLGRKNPTPTAARGVGLQCRGGRTLLLIYWGGG